MSALNVDMGRHVDQVTGVGDEFAQRVARLQRLLRERGHLHQVNVEMQEAGVAHCVRVVVQGRFEMPPAPRAFPRLGRFAGA